MSGSHHTSAGLQSELARLEDAYQVLTAKWQTIREEWRDGNAEAVEQNYLVPLSVIIRNTAPAIGQIGDELNRSIRACSEPEERY